MKVAVLPFNAAEGTPPALGRQFSAFACDTIRAATSADINPVSFLAQIDDEGTQRAAFVNIADTLLDAAWISQMFEQSQVDLIMDGLLKKSEDQFELTVRFHSKGEAEPSTVHEWKFSTAELFGKLEELTRALAKQGEIALPEALATGKMEFGTDSADAFLLFLEGYDAVTYIQQANGMVAKEFDPKMAMDTLLKSLELDNDFVGPYEMLVQLCRLCGQYRLGSFDDTLAALKSLVDIEPEDYKAHFAMGELYSVVGDHANASNSFEKALQLETGEPAIYARLGLAQMNLGMPVNAERNFKKAIELEGDDKPSLDLLAMTLQQTNRAHEVPALWKEQVDKHPTNANLLTKHAISLVNAGQTDAGHAAFEEALTKAEDPLVVKRYFAPLLAQKGELDRAMDFYEDCLDVHPNDQAVLLEYAQTLKAANRVVDLQRVLRDILSTNPDPNTRATTLAELIEIEQAKRVESVEAAKQKMQDGQFDQALQSVRPLKNWLADYWPMWAVLSSAANQARQFEEAEDAARRLIELFPACEPAYGELNTALDGLGKHEEAYNIMRFAASNLPQSLGVHVNLALAAKRFGRTDEAAAIAKQIREAVGPNPDLDDVLAEIDK